MTDHSLPSATDQALPLAPEGVKRSARISWPHSVAKEPSRGAAGAAGVRPLVQVM
jgi:hypothetical protein